VVIGAGARRSFADVVTVDCKAAGSIGLSAGEFAMSTGGAIALAILRSLVGRKSGQRTAR